MPRKLIRRSDRSGLSLRVALVAAAALLTAACEDDELPTPSPDAGGGAASDGGVPDAPAPAGEAGAPAPDGGASGDGGVVGDAGLTAFADLTPGKVNVLRPGGTTICSRGTEYAFFVIPAARDKVIIEFEGGGACWDETTCGYAKSLFRENVDIARHTANLSGTAGWYDHSHAGHPLKDWTHVFIPYCTGDIHWGDSVKTYGTGAMAYTINHKGAVNATAALDWVYGQFTAPAKVFVTGCSAGGYGSIFWAPHVQKHYPSAKVYHFSDSAAGVITVDFFQKSFPVWNVGAHYPSFIGDFAKVTSLSQMYREASAYFPSNVFSQYNTILDANQTLYYVAMGGKDNVEWSGKMKASIKEIQTAAPNFRAFLAEGEQHCILPQPNFYDAQAGGTKLVDWLADMANDKPIASAYCPTCMP
jgi:hypothetical protein